MKQTISDLGEWGIIDLLTKGEVRRDSQLLCGVGDDAAVIKGRSQPWLVTTDHLVQGVHYDPKWMPWEHLGDKALQVNLSDIAAMGGRPLYYLLNLSLPVRFSKVHLRALQTGLKRSARTAGVTCIGGDTTRSRRDVMLGLTVLGLAPKKVPTRDRARASDDIYVSGCLGQAALGLKLLQRRRSKLAGATAYCRRQTRPRARVALGQALVKSGQLHAMIDISDGLLADLGHILAASQVGAALKVGALKSSAIFQRLCQQLRVDPQGLRLSGGEDYELLFTAKAGQEARFQQIARRHRIPITKLGKITRRKDLVCFDEEGKKLQLNKLGYEHFR